MQDGFLLMNIFYIHKTRISKSTIYINKPSTDMVQNTNMQYILIQNARVLALVLTDLLLPPNSLEGARTCMGPTQAVKRVVLIS